MSIARLLLCLLCCLLVLTAGSAGAVAAEYLWTGDPGDGVSWVDDYNWAVNGVCFGPGYCYPRTASDIAIFSPGIDVGTVCLSTQSIDTLTVVHTLTFDDCNSGNPVLTVNGFTLSSNQGAKTLTFSSGAKLQN